MKALILGATGFIGGAVARAAAAKGWEVRALRRREGWGGAIGDLAVEWVHGDLADLDSLSSAMAGCDVVFHAAAYYPAGAADVPAALRQAVSGMRNVLAAAASAGLKRFVYTSSLSTVGPAATVDRLANEDDYYLLGSMPHPYFEAKWAMEAEAFRAAAQGLSLVVVNPTACFGPGDVKPITGMLLIALARGLVRFYVEGEMNLVDVRDVAAAQVAAAERGRIGQRYILGGHNLPVSQALALAAEVAGVPPPRWRLPMGLAYTLARAAEVVGSRAGVRFAGAPTYVIRAVQHGRFLDTGKAQRELGLSPRPLAETFRDSLDWFRRNGYL